MSFAVVEFDEEISVAVIKKKWIINSKLCHYPATTKIYNKFINQDDDQLETYKTWAKFDCKILQNNIGKDLSLYALSVNT